MGGHHATADIIGNVAFLCWAHARNSDGGALIKRQYGTAHRALLGDRWLSIALEGNLAWERAEALRAHLKATRPPLIVDTPTG